MIARVSLLRRMKSIGLKSLLVSSVHDSIVADCPEEEYKEVGNLMRQVVQDVPQNFERLFKVHFNLPLTAEVLYGINMKDMQELT